MSWDRTQENPVHLERVTQPMVSHFIHLQLSPRVLVLTHAPIVFQLHIVVLHPAILVHRYVVDDWVTMLLIAQRKDTLVVLVE